MVTSSTMRSSSRRGIHSAPPSRWCASPASNASACAWAAANSSASAAVSAVLSRPAAQVDTRCVRATTSSMGAPTRGSCRWRSSQNAMFERCRSTSASLSLVAFAQRPSDAGERIAPLGSTDTGGCSDRIGETRTHPPGQWTGRVQQELEHAVRVHRCPHQCETELQHLDRPPEPGVIPEIRTAAAPPARGALSRMTPSCSATSSVSAHCPESRTNSAMASAERSRDDDLTTTSDYEPSP